MSLVEAAAALDRLLRGYHDGGAAPNTPPYAPPLVQTPDDDDNDNNLLPTFFPSALNHRDARTSSTPVEGSVSHVILPWEDLPTVTLEESLLPVTPFCTSLPPLPSPIPQPPPSLSPYLSPIPLPSPSLSIVPSPISPSHWLASLDQCPSLEGDILGIGIISKTPQSPEGVRKRRRRRRNTRGEQEGSSVLSDDFVPLDPEKYKTELCRSFQVHSYCRYGVSHRNSLLSKNLPGTEMTSSLVIDVLMIACERCIPFCICHCFIVSCRCNYAHGLQELRGASRHGKYKTRNCQSYHQTGFCRYGARCSFIHDPEEGVLKCSIANKEVLEALHYRPSSVDSPRTANITWRILEALGEPASELHFIRSTEPSQEATANPVMTSVKVPEEFLSPTSFSSAYPLQSHINLLISSEDGVLDESRLLAYSFPIVNDTSGLESAQLLEENLNLLLSLQVGDESSKFQPLQNEEDEYSASLSFFDATVADQSQVVGSSFLLDQKISLCESSSVFPWPLSPIESPRIQELGQDDEPILNAPVKPAAGTLPNGNICQELEAMEVVHTILKRAPLYSATVWSDGTDIPPNLATESSDAATQSKEHTENVKDDFTENTQEVENVSHRREKKEVIVSKRKTKNPPRRKRKTWHKKKLSETENLHLLKDDHLHSPLDDSVFSSTFQTDSDSDLENECKVSTDAAGPDGDDWSEKSSLHLADLLRSLRLREGNNQLLPWSKSSRRYSSDGSSAGLLSAKDLRSCPSSPASPRQHDMTKYKTELCRSFQYNGYCSYGDACLYAHGPSDMRSYPKHPMYRTKQCFSFHNKGFCLYGSRCQFLHDLE